MRADGSEQDSLSALLSDGGALHRYVRKRLGTTLNADDVVQETHLRLVEQSRKREIENMTAYAFRVADSVIYAMRAKRAVTVELCEDTFKCDLPLVDEQVEHRERLRRLSERLDLMPALRRTVFVQRHLEGLSRSAIARKLCLSEEAVKKHLVRAMADLARHMDEDGADAAPTRPSKGGRRP